MSCGQLAWRRRARRALTGSLAALAVAGGAATAVQAAEVDVTAAPYAAAGDGSTNDRAAIQQAIDDQSAAGGGTVVLKSGRTFVSGDLRLKQGVELRIDGVLAQSQQVAHYSSAPTLGHYNARGDLANFTNLPLIFASHTRDVAVSGSGRIQMTLASGGLGQTIQIAAIGFYEVTDYEIRDIGIHEGHVYHVMLYGTRRGLVDSIHIRSPEPDPVTGEIEANTDGISLQNSSDIRITGSRIETDDDSLYIWSSYYDPRGGEDTWWRANPRPSRNIRIDGNTLQAGHNGHGFAFIAWGASAPDQSQVEISDVVLEDNLIEGGPPYGYAVGCWCQDPYNKAPWTGSGYGDQSPITRVTFRGNTYPQGQIRPMLISDLTSDFPMLSAGTSLNGDFASADAAWNRTGSTGVATGSDLPDTFGADARTAAERMDGRFGWVAGGAQRSAWSQVLGLGGAAPLQPLGVDGTYRVSAEVATGGGDAVLFVRNLCSDETVLSKTLPAGTSGRQTATFRLAADCGRVEVGLELAAGASGWALLDDFQVKAPMMHALDPGILYAGYWAPHREPGEWRGSHMSSASPGQTAIITFEGTRARVVGLRSEQIGIIRFSVDGGPAQEVDLYSPTLRLEQVLFDTGTLPPGEHTIKVEPTGSKNPAATYTAFAFDGVLVDEPALTINRPRLDFGSVPAESRSQAKHVTLVASDAGTVDVGDVTLAGDTPEQFDVDASACSGRTLSAGGSCTLTIAFAPIADGDHRAVVRVAGPGGVQEIGLAGVTPDGYPLAERYSDVIDDRDPRAIQTGAWGNTYQYAEDIGGYHLVGFDTSAVVKARFTGTRVTIWATTDFNLGTADVFIDGEHAGVADFVSPQAVRGTSVFDSELLEPGEHDIEMRTKSGLSVFDAFLVSGGTTAAADRTAVDFGSVTEGEQSAVERVTVTARGTGRLKIGGVRLVGAQPGDFALVPGGCARDTVLAAGESCSVDVRFAPSAVGERTAKLRIADTSDAGATVVALSGVGRAIPPVDRRDDERRDGGGGDRGGGEQPPVDGPGQNPPGGGDPGQGPPGGDRPTPPGGGRTAGPALTKLSLSAKRVKAGRGLGLRFTSSKPARLTVVLERQVPGRVAGGRCRIVKAAPARGRRCVVVRTVRTLRTSASDGANRVTIPTRIGKRTLATGSYRLRITAVDAEGRRTTPKPLAFAVRKR